MWIEQEYEMKKVSLKKSKSHENSNRKTLLQKSMSLRHSMFESGKTQHLLDSLFVRSHCFHFLSATDHSKSEHLFSKITYATTSLRKR